jgi:hypothetical protein
MRGYLWQDLEAEIAAEVAQAHPFVQLLTSVPFERKTDNWHIESELGYVRGYAADGSRLEPQKSTAAVKSLRDTRRSLGLCIDCDRPRDPKSKSYCTTHRELDRVRNEEKRKRAGKTVRGRYKERGMKEKLPDDRQGSTLHFKILSRGEERADGSSEVKEVDGYLTMNTCPDGKTLRELFVRVGKAGASDALLDEWAKQASNRLQEGASVDEVFRTHVGTRFGDSGAVKCVRGISSCTSVLDLISRVVIARFGAKEAA